MSWLEGLRQRTRVLLRRRAVERELEEELAFHLEQEPACAHDAGVAGADARRHARLVFGGADRVREEVRDAWPGSTLRGLRHDTRHALRRLLAQPGLSLVALVTLGLGMGANAAMFALVRAILLEPLPYGETNELVVLWNPASSLAENTHFSDRELLEYRAATRSFASLAAYAGRRQPARRARAGARAGRVCDGEHVRHARRDAVARS